MSSQAIIFRETRESKGFYALLAALGVFLVLGAIAFFYIEHHGHYVTGMNNQVVWGLPHVFAIFLIVSASGALNIGSIGTVFGKRLYQPMGRLSALLAMSLLIGGLIVLVLDLGHPDRLIVAMTHYNFRSIFAWNIILYIGFLALSAIYIWTMMDRHAKTFYKTAGVAAFTWRLILTTGTGSIFGFLVARDFYNSAVMAPLFIVMSFAFGLAIFILVLHFAYKWTGRELGDVVMNRLRYLLAVFIAGVLLLEAARHLTSLYIAQRAGVEHFILFGGGLYTQLFWIVQILLGSLLPMSLIFCRQLVNNRVALLLAAAFTIVGGLAQLYVILVGGQAYPMALFPGAIVSSDFFDGVVNTYSPGIWELMLGLGGVALALVLVVIGVKVLRFLPESLSDRVVDPHSK